MFLLGIRLWRRGRVIVVALGTHVCSSADFPSAEWPSRAAATPPSTIRMCTA